MEKLKCIIIDDEPIAADYLSEYVLKTPSLKLISAYNKASEAIPELEKGNVDIIFLDIEMPELNGLDFIRTLHNPPAIIITTAYSQYAMEGFELDVVDYLLKPINFERFSKAVLKVTKGFNTPNLPKTIHQCNFIFLKSGYKAIKINFEDITHIEGMKEYIIFYTTDNQKYIKNERMKNIEELLLNHNFIRVHKSFLVSLNHVNAFYGNTIEITGHKIPIGRMYKNDLKKIVGE